ncbi:hypothetical protein AX17_006993 [Amanita inopinata Kibby_2008]|nr:hypothetical protein AX17_006993 [Amanita inopinata Kibby_2008]
MLIKLIPEPPHPAVLFALTFPNTPFAYPPDRPYSSVQAETVLGTPIALTQGWVNQLTAIALDDLDAPVALHALDRAAGVATLLQEVTFDIPSCTVRCSFIDGSVEEWIWPIGAKTVPTAKRPRSLSGASLMRRYIDMLDGVVKDVNQSTVEEEREKQEELFALQQQQLEQQRRRSESSVPPPAPHRQASKTHKKQRSFFMNFVASIVNLSPASSVHSHPRLPPPLSPLTSSPSKRTPWTVPLPLTPTTPQTPAHVTSPFPLLWTPNHTPRQILRPVEPAISASRALRWRARSTLVDTFRRFVLPEIVVRSSFGTYRNYHAINVNICGEGAGKVGAGYYMWVIESVLRRAGERIDELASMAAAAGSELMDRDRDRRTRAKIFPRFSVPRRKIGGTQELIHQASMGQLCHATDEDTAERERERREAEYFASTTQSVQPPPLFSDEEDSTEDAKDARSVSRSDHNAILVEDEDCDTIESDTDGSSVHTPSSGHDSFTFPPSPAKLVKSLTIAPSPVSPRRPSSLPRVVSPLPTPRKPSLSFLTTECLSPGSLPPVEMAEYKSLSRLTGKLQHLLISARARAAQAESEAKQRELLLEMRSRRRAWLNRSLGSNTADKASGGKSDGGCTTYGYLSSCVMATPYKSSPLARWVWTSEDWEYVPPGYDEEYDDDIILQERMRFNAGDEDGEQVGFGYRLKRMSAGRGGKMRGETTLFPVSEEEEDCERVMDSRHAQGDEEALMGMGIGEEGLNEDLRELELGLAGFGLDLEGGDMAWAEDEEMGLPRGEYRLTSNAAGGPGVKVAFDIERPRVRVRTNSMYEHSASFGRHQIQQSLNLKGSSDDDEKTSSFDSCSESSPPGLAASSLLCQPLTTNNSGDVDGGNLFKPQAVFTPPTSIQVDASIIPDFITTADGAVGMDEFTLSMDLPLPLRVRSPPPMVRPGILGSDAKALTLPLSQNGRLVQLETVPDAR